VQARLVTRRFPTAVLAFAFALMAVVMLGAADGYVMSILTAPAVHSAQGPTTSTVQGGPNSDLTRALPQQAAQGGPSSDLTRALPSGRVAGNSSPCDSLRPHGVC
jgi:hypothetical protein